MVWITVLVIGYISYYIGNKTWMNEWINEQYYRASQSVASFLSKQQIQIQIQIQIRSIKK
jgi:hypothetical protein